MKTLQNNRDRSFPFSGSCGLKGKGQSTWYKTLLFNDDNHNAKFDKNWFINMSMHSMRVKLEGFFAVIVVVVCCYSLLLLSVLLLFFLMPPEK